MSKYHKNSQNLQYNNKKGQFLCEACKCIRRISMCLNDGNQTISDDLLREGP